jgi:hypothetical protein
MTLPLSAHLSLTARSPNDRLTVAGCGSSTTINAIYNFGPRLALASRWGKETLAGGAGSSSPTFLADGSDSVGVQGALTRAYLNAGLFSEEWLRHFNSLIGGKPITPIEIKVARQKSSYWQATEAQMPTVEAFLLACTGPHHLKDAPGGAAYLTPDMAKLTRGKESLRRPLRALSLEQDPGSRARSRRRRRMLRAGLPRLLEPVLGVDQDRWLQAEDAADRAGPLHI